MFVVGDILTAALHVIAHLALIAFRIETLVPDNTGTPEKIAVKMEFFRSKYFKF